MSYNGWTNYATWRVYLEWFDGFEDFELFGSGPINPDVVKEHVEAGLAELGNGVVLDYALAFLADVDWREIAEHLEPVEDMA